MKKPITIKDIAERLKVSVATVSRALRGSTEIKPETKEAVLKMAKDLDYHPNLLASSLSSKRSKIIGVVVPTINRFFWSNSISGIENIAYKENYKVMIFQSGESYKKELEIVETLANSRVDGIIIAFSKETTNYDHIESVMNRGIPVTLFERVTESIKTCKIVTDDFAGAKEITEHLLARNRRRIVHIGGPRSLEVCRERLAGYRAALREQGIAPDPNMEIELSEFSFDTGGETIERLWRRLEKPDALFCFADIIAIGALHAAHNLGISVPEELAIAGFGDDITSKFIRPALTTMAQPSFEMGQTAAKMLLHSILENEVQEDCDCISVKPTLMVRDST
ncbi:LacI family DNA-binding transcriptional regulator [Lunatimonas lonarensis]|uniref:LacI family DNA-binding transcriptional regulator n=1 Tax=Lunatimonas lonarensis TaxID=1232681 RepID=UPI00055F0EA6|nr:LacI family DNA-binding transcriptional regulator [Lunatimonas lonarensis]